MRRLGNTIAVLIAVAFLVGCASTAYRNASTANTIASYEQFHRKYPDSEFAREAKRKLDALYFQKAEGQATIQAYESFLERRPNSSQASEAKRRLEHLYVERDWAVAQENDDVQGYGTFLSQHPNSSRAQEAASRKQLLEKYRASWEKLQSEPSIQSFRDYCDQNPDSPYLQSAKMAIQDMEGRDIVDLIREKKIEIETKGSGIQSVSVRVRKLVPYPVTVCVPLGSYFVSARSSAQNMVTTAESKVRLAGDDWRSLSVSAACANRPRGIPGRGDTFTVQRSPHQEELARLMPVLNKARVSFATRQAAVWIVTDNASYSNLGILVSRPAYSAFGGTRTIREAETARAMKICEEAGIDITRKRIWNDRQSILQGLADGELKTWLNEKQ